MAEGEGQPLEAWAPLAVAVVVPLVSPGLQPGWRLESLSHWGLGGGLAPGGGIGNPYHESTSGGHMGNVSR